MTSRNPIIALCVAVMLALTGHSMAVARSAPEAKGQMVLCIGAVPVAVYVDENGAPTQAPQFCPECTLLSLDHSFQPTWVMPLGVAKALEPVPLRGTNPDRTALVSYLSRAPPVVV